MSSKTPEYVLRDRTNGRLFGVNPHLESDPNFEKVPFAQACPELCMPEHIKEKVSGKTSTKKKSTNKKTPTKKQPALDLETQDIPEDPDEILSEDTLSSEIDEALSEDASRGL